MPDRDSMADDCWVEVRTATLAANFDAIARLAGRPVAAVVKANAFGHGLAEVGRLFEAAGAAMLCVATLGEAEILRRAGVRCPLLLLYAVAEPRYGLVQDLQVDVIASSRAELARLAAFAWRGAPPRVHVEADIGMARIGCAPEDVGPMLQTARDLGLEVAGLSTHFWGADLLDLSGARAQLAVFESVLAAVSSAGLRPPVVHAANSAAALRLPGSRFDMIRAGLILYGHSPAEGLTLPAGVAPALSWKARVASVRSLRRGQGAGYGHAYLAPRDLRLAILPVGYADGLRRFPGDANRVLLGGVECPIINRLCMDVCYAEVPDGLDVRDGDEAILIGSQGGASIRAEDVARRWMTNTYDVLASIGERAPRRHVGALMDR